MTSLSWTELVDPERGLVERTLRDMGFGTTQVEQVATLGPVGLRRPTLQVEATSGMCCVRTLHYDEDTSSVESGVTWVVWSGEHAVVLRRTPPGAPDVPRESPTGDPRQVLGEELRRCVTEYAQVCGELEVDVEEVEASVFSSSRATDAEQIYLLKREVAEVRRAVAPLLTVLEDATVQEIDQLPHAIEVLHHCAESVESLQALLASVFDAYAAQISLQQNADMRRISAGAALVVVPTLVAGIYGMNFHFMPELEWQYGYAFALSLMAGAVALLTWLFRRSGWF